MLAALSKTDSAANVKKCSNMITKHWNIWYIARGGWVGFYCFLTDIFVITLKYLQNIAKVRFQFVKIPWKK